MTIRFYVLPIQSVVVESTTYRGPKYFRWRQNPSGLTDPWNMIDFGMIDSCVLVSDISADDHTTLIANADVLAVPVNIDANLNATARDTAQTFLETYNIPAQWITNPITYREVLRKVCGMFLYVQRVTAILGRTISLGGGVLNLQLSAVPADIRAAMAQAATEMNYDYSWVLGTTTVRVLLKGMSDAWGASTIFIGMANL